MKNFQYFMMKLWGDESGVSSVEYALLLTFIAGAIIFSTELLANSVSNEISGAAACISSSGGSC